MKPRKFLKDNEQFKIKKNASLTMVCLVNNSLRRVKYY